MNLSRPLCDFMASTNEYDRATKLGIASHWGDQKTLLSRSNAEKCKFKCLCGAPSIHSSGVASSLVFMSLLTKSANVVPRTNFANKVHSQQKPVVVKLSHHPAWLLRQSHSYYLLIQSCTSKSVRVLSPLPSSLCPCAGPPLNLHYLLHSAVGRGTLLRNGFAVTVQIPSERNVIVHIFGQYMPK